MQRDPRTTLDETLICLRKKFEDSITIFNEYLKRLQEEMHHP